MTKVTFNKKANRLMREILQFEDKALEYSIEDVKEKCTYFMSEATKLIIEYPDSGYLKEVIHALDRIEENRKNNTTWRD